MQFQLKFTQKEDINAIIDLYNKKYTMKTIARKYKCDQQTIKKLLVRNGVCLKPNPGSQKYTVNENYFENIDSHEKSQILGVLAADGNVYKRTLRIAFDKRIFVSIPK